MNRKKNRAKLTLFLITIFTFQLNHSQENINIPKYLLNKAIKKMENRQYEEALSLLENAKSIDTGNLIIYPYEIAVVYYLQHDYNKAINILTKIKKQAQATDQVYQLLGNCYYLNSNTNSAIDIYNEGLSKFPKSGLLFLELGIVEYDKKNYQGALSFFEKGIMISPNYSSNYYWAAKIYFRSSYKLNGLIYGEIFMNLEKIGQRAEEMSELLYVIYKNIISLSDTSSFVDFNKDILYGDKIELNDSLSNKNLSKIYIQLFDSAVKDERMISMHIINRIRTKIITSFYSNGYSKDYANILFEYQKDIMLFEYFDAYNHWLLKKGNQNEFGEWYEKNTLKWDRFVDWFMINNIQIDSDKKYYTKQYD